MSSNLTVEGKLVAKLDALSGESQNGPWVRREFILELPSSGSYVNKLCVELWGERTSLIDQFQEGEDLVVSIDLSSREFNGKWYTRVRAWQIQRAVPGGMPYQGMPQGYPQQPMPQPGYTPSPQYAPQPSYPQPAPQPPMQPSQGPIPANAPTVQNPPPIPDAGSGEDLPF